jgi:hypothetical protein
MSELTPSGHRPLYLIAAEIKANWPKSYFGAVPYLDTLAQLVDISDPYFEDDARTMVIYFLANANTWRGETARRVKAELKALAGLK